MAKAECNMDFSGSLGNMVFYKVNGKMYARKKRSKMTKAQKKKKSFKGSMRVLTKSQPGIQFGKSLRWGIKCKDKSYSHLHSRMTGFIHKSIVDRDTVHNRDEMTILAEHVHYLEELITNDEFPIKIFDAMLKTKLKLEDEKLVVEVPGLPVTVLGKEVDGYSIWIDAKFISLADYNIVWHKVDPGSRVVGLKKGKFEFSFDVSPKGDGEILAVAIGLKSFKGDKWVEGKDVNGFLWRVLG